MSDKPEMYDDTKPRTDPHDHRRPESRHVHHATGVLVLALRVPPEQAQARLFDVATTYGVPTGALARAIVAVSAGLRVDDHRVREVLWREWGDLLA